VRAEGAAAEAPPLPARILVVDDDALVGRAMSRMLSRRHEVVFLSDARSALDRLRSGPAFDVVFCDLMMPQLTGIDLHDALAAERPELAARMIFTTGGAFTPQARAFADAHAERMLLKPFDARTLEAAVDRVLGAGKAPGGAPA
jgi:CheY-like chemotaxis protein